MVGETWSSDGNTNGDERGQSERIRLLTGVERLAALAQKHSEERRGLVRLAEAAQQELTDSRRAIDAVNAALSTAHAEATALRAELGMQQDVDRELRAAYAAQAEAHGADLARLRTENERLTVQCAALARSLLAVNRGTGPLGLRIGLGLARVLHRLAFWDRPSR